MIAEKQPFKGVENYFTDSLLYQDSLEVNKDPPGDPDSGNEADIEPEPDDDFLCELNPLVINIDKLDVNPTADDVGE